MIPYRGYNNCAVLYTSRGERGYGTQWVMNGTHVNFETVRSRKQHYITLQCSGGFQKLVPVAGWTSEKPYAFNAQFIFLLICIIKRPDIKISGGSTAV
jgi:hypothetical protein